MTHVARKLAMSGLLPMLASLAALTCTAPTAQATVGEGHPELYDNFVKVGATHIAVLGIGPMKWVSPGLGTEIECLTQFFGGAWNEGGTLGRGEILGWSAQGHASANGRELSRECNFKKGTATVEAWMTDEPPLPSGTAGERGQPLTVPWNLEYRCGEHLGETEETIIKIGIPTGTTATPGCKSEAVEDSEIQSEEQQHTGCYTGPAPKGCIKIDMVEPAVGLETVMEGTLRPRSFNGFGSGLNPTLFVYEGETSGRLRLSTNAAVTFSATGSTTFSGLPNYALIIAR